MNDAELYRLYLEQLAQQEQANSGNSIQNLKGYAAKANKLGNSLSKIGDSLKNNVNNQVAQKLGTSMSNIGGKLSSKATGLQNTLNAPQNYFKGWANQNIGNGLTKAGQYLANKTGIAGTIGNGLQNVGTSMTNAGAGIGTATTGTGAAATGTTTAGAGTAGGTVAGAGVGTEAGVGGAAAGGSGAAAGGSSAGGAAAGGPIGALIALAVMAAAGKNRKGAEKDSRQLMKATNKEVSNGSDNALAETQQVAEQLGTEANQNLQNGIATGGAAPIQEDNTNIPTTKEAFAQSLRDNGWDESGINSALNGLNNGNKEMSDYINYYNTVAQDGQQISVPQTEEEIANARNLASGQTANPQQSGNVQQTEQIKRGLLDKFISGITDFSAGYDENKNNAFKPTNLANKQFTITDENGNVNTINKGKMGRLGELAGTIGRMTQKPGVQALVAGGLSTALTGNPLYGLEMANKFGEQRARTNAYQNMLQKQGVNYDPGMFGTLNNTDFNALMTPQYKEAVNNLALAKLNEQQNYHDLMMKYYNEKLEETKKQNDIKNQQNGQKIAIQANKAKNGTTVTHISKKNGGKKQTNKNESTVKMQAPNGKVYLVPESQIGRYKKAGGKIVG